MSISRHSTFRGDILWMTHSRVGKILVKVIKVNPKNIKVETEAGKLWNCNPHFLSETTSVQAAEWGTGASSAVIGDPTGIIPIPAAGSPLMLGQAVRFKDKTVHALRYGKDNPVLVVLGSTKGKYRLARLGGHKDQYFTGILPHQVEVVEFDLAGV